jgi:apolipoprotein D and lipocalin family protein
VKNVVINVFISNLYVLYRIMSGSTVGLVVFIVVLVIVATIITWYVIRKDQINGITPVEKVSIEKYQGKWYEIATIPKSFEKGCTNSTANYTINPDMSITVTNSCQTSSSSNVKHATATIDPRFVSIETSPTALNPDSVGTVIAPGRLDVKFQGVPFNAKYWIVELDPNYQWAVVSSPFLFADFLWILCRTHTMDNDIYNQLVARLKERRFPVEKLVKTIQQ